MVEFKRKPFQNKANGSVLITVPRKLVDEGLVKPGLEYSITLVLVGTEQGQESQQGVSFKTAGSSPITSNGGDEITPSSPDGSNVGGDVV